MDIKKERDMLLATALAAAVTVTLLGWAETQLSELFLWTLFDPETAGWKSF